MTAYSVLREAEIERRERDPRQRLSAKYNGDGARPDTAPVMIGYAALHAGHPAELASAAD